MSSADGQMVTVDSRNARNVWLIQVGFLLLLCAWFLLRGIFPSIAALFAFSIILFGWRSQVRGLLRDLLPFFVLLLTYQALRGYADDLAPFEIHITDLIGYEKALFGGVIPASWIQTRLAGSFWAPIVNYTAGVLYMAHFVTPLLVAILLWKRRKSYYWPYVIGFLILTYAGFLTYLLYPACPPWLAYMNGFLDQPVEMHSFRGLIEFAGPNMVAAMPSLHVAYPTFIACFLTYVFGRKAAPVLLLPFAVGFATVVLGHHYVVDLLVGAVYGLVVFAGVVWWVKRHTPEPTGELSGVITGVGDRA